MINRILIRIKVVQILYSYLLTKGEFKLETFNDNISRDKKYASSFYFDLILLILKLSGYNIGNKANITPSLLQNCKISCKVAKYIVYYLQFASFAKFLQILQEIRCKNK